MQVDHLIQSNFRYAQPITCLAVDIAAWMRYVAGITAAGETCTIGDPLASSLARLQESRSIEKRLRALVGLETVFGIDLPRNPAFLEPVRAAYLGL